MKIFKLFIDENIKTWKKFSTKLAIFLIFLALIAALGMAKITQNLDAKNNGQTVYYEGNWKEDVEAEIKSYKEQLNNSSLSEFEKKQIENEIIIDEIRIQKNINSYSISQIIKMYIEFWYFSVITFSTVGFGDMIINGIIGKILVCFEVFIGITIQSTWAALIIKRMFR